MSHRSLKAVLFDLDGTLADTAPDLAAALNAVRQEQCLPPMAYEQIRPIVSNGSKALIELGFDFDDRHPDFERLRLRLLDIYNENLTVGTRLFPKMAELLDELEAQNMPWGVVTNKPGFLTEPLLQQMQLSHRAACIVSGDTTEKRKPHPDPILYACKIINTAPEDCLYVGDARRDIEAGRAAGTQTLTALFGYIPAHETPHEWQADAEALTVDDIIHYIRERRAL